MRHVLLQPEHLARAVDDTDVYKSCTLPRKIPPLFQVPTVSKNAPSTLGSLSTASVLAISGCGSAESPIDPSTPGSYLSQTQDGCDLRNTLAIFDEMVLAAVSGVSFMAPSTVRVSESRFVMVEDLTKQKRIIALMRERCCDGLETKELLCEWPAESTPGTTYDYSVPINATNDQDKKGRRI